MNYRAFKLMAVQSLQPEVVPGEAEAFFFLWLEQQTGWRKTQYSLQAEQEVPEELCAQWNVLVPRLRAYEPIQYVLGEAWFMGRRFEVGSGVLIPRPETEELVEWVLQTFPPHTAPSGVDIGCGSGCIGLSLALERPQGSWQLWDISETALQLSLRNQNQLSAQALIVQQDALQLPQMPAHFDCIVSNPPYIRPSEKADMQANVLDYEPDLALFVPEHDPLLFYRAIAFWAQTALTPSGWLFFEINQYLGADMFDMLKELGFTAQLKHDIYGNARMIRAQFSPESRPE